jgi:DNA polymerase-3 subunit alpha
VNLRAVNKRNIENLSLAGAFDTLLGNDNRALFFYQETPSKPGLLDQLIRYGQSAQEGQTGMANTLFSDSSNEITIPEPVLPTVEPWHVLEMLEKEKEVVGIYLSGHPLDNYRLEMGNFRFVEIEDLKQLHKLQNKSDMKSGGIITDVNHRISKKGNPFGTFRIEDYSGSSEFSLFSEKYLRMKHFLEVGNIIYFNWKISSRFDNPDNLEAEIMSMGLLADLKDKYSQVTIGLKERDLNEEFIRDFSSIILRFPGRCNLRIQLSGVEEGMELNLLSEHIKVDGGNPEFQEQINKMLGSKSFLLN